MRTIEEQYELLEVLLAIAKRGGENGELDWLEFKTNIAEQSASITYEGVGKYISGMANIACVKYKDYAYLVLGIENATWNPVGTNLRMQDQKINNQDYQLWLRKLVEPHIRFEFEEFDYKGKHIVIFEIPAAVGEPVTFKGEAYIRINSNLTKLKDFTDYTRQIYSSQQDWSAQIVKDATLDDLDPRAITRARELYIDKHQHLASDVASWDDKTFLNKAKITRNGRITNTAIILLGKEESEVLISPAVSKIRWILKGTDGVERDYRILSCPMVLAIDEVFHLVRNLKYRYINPNLRTLFPEEIDTYEPYVIREALNNAVAHQDYSKSGVVNVVEFDDRLLFTNLGSFIPGSIQAVLQADSPWEKNRNRFLANAMVELKMVDTIGSGIKKMFRLQKGRLFPMPDYDFRDGRVTLTVFGRIIDMNYTNILMQNADISLEEAEMLNRVQLGKPLTDFEISHLRKRHLVEGRKNALVLAKPLAQATGKKVEYSKHKGLTDKACESLIMTALRDHGELSRKEINELLSNSLSDILTDKQRYDKISNILRRMRLNGLITNRGAGNVSFWRMVNHS